MIYRIHPNVEDFLMLTFDGDKAREVLGEDTDFYMDERPVPYSANWQPMEVGFSDALGGKNKKELPDISLNVGKPFLSEKSYKILKYLIENNGEFLPVKYDGGRFGKPPLFQRTFQMRPVYEKHESCKGLKIIFPRCFEHFQPMSYFASKFFNDL